MRPDNMRRISICQFSSFRWTFLEDVIRYATFGFDSLGVWRRKIDDVGIDAATDLLYETKMSVSSLHWAGGFTGDGQSFVDGIEDAIQAIEMASQLNAGCLIIHPGSRNGHTTPHARRLFASALSSLLPIAKDYGVKLALEPTFGKQSSCWTFLDRFDCTLDVMEQFTGEPLGLVLDLHHVGFDSRVFCRLAEFVDRVELVQLSDRRSKDQGDRLPLGQGEIPIRAWLAKLQQLGYAGQFELEVHGGSTPNPDYFSLLDETHDYFNRQPIKSLMGVCPRDRQVLSRYLVNRED